MSSWLRRRFCTNACPALCDARPAESFETMHRPEPGLPPAVMGFEGVVRVLLHHVVGGGPQLIQHSWVARCFIGAHLGRSRAVVEGAGDEPAGARQIPLLRCQHVDDLAELVDGPVQIDPPPGDLDLGLIHKPAVSRRVTARPRGVDEQGGEPLYPPARWWRDRPRCPARPRVLPRHGRKTRSAETSAPPG